MSEPVLSVEHLTVQYRTRRGSVHAVNDVSFELHPGESLGLVGESGCGKTTLALALMRILPDNAAILAGRIRLNGVDLAALSEKEMQRYRGRRISMVFQAAMNSLDPVYRVGDQIVEAIAAHERVSPAEAEERVKSLFSLVGLDETLIPRYPHEYSGGMRQRAVIAMALSSNPEVIIADEPTTALDVIVQDRIIKKLRGIQTEREMAMIYISHDVAVIAEVTDRVGVMYAGRLVELAPTAEIFANPIHPYTEALLASIPSVRGEKRPLRSLGGEPPDLMEIPPGCPFEPRCSRASEICVAEMPSRIGVEARWALCWNPVNTPSGSNVG